MVGFPLPPAKVQAHADTHGVAVANPCPPIIVSRGCRQYAFFATRTLRIWAARPAYGGETFTLMLLDEGRLALTYRNVLASELATLAEANLA